MAIDNAEEKEAESGRFSREFECRRQTESGNENKSSEVTDQVDEDEDRVLSSPREDDRHLSSSLEEARRMNLEVSGSAAYWLLFLTGLRIEKRHDF